VKNPNLKSATVIITIFLLLTIITFGPRPIAGAGVETASLTDFDVSDADIRDVLRSLSELGDINVLLDPVVKGNVTIKLKHGMPIKDAMELVVQTYGYSYRWIVSTRTMIIGTEKTFVNFEILETRIYRLTYANAKEMVEQLKVIVAKDNVAADIRTNQLTIKASVLQHQNVAEVIARLDREMPQLSIECRIEELTRSAVKKLGIGYEFSLGTSDVNFRLTTIASLEAMEKLNQAKLVARPNISTTDSQEGKIFIGDKLPIITSSQTDAGITYSYTYIEVGTKLTVTPRINENDTVTVNVKAESSTIYDWKSAGSTGDVPLIRTREASSVVRLREGETFILSGLNLSRSSLTTEQVPGLSKIPIFGNLFKKRINDPGMEETELVIFITPRIIKARPIATPTPSPTGTSTPTATPAPVTPLTIPSPSAIQPEPTPTPTPSPSAALVPTPAPSGSPGVPISPMTTIVPETPSPGTTASPLPAVTPAVSASPASSLLPSPSAAVIPSTSPAASAAPQPTSAAIESIGLKANRIVKAGETVESIAKKYGIVAESIRQANGLKPTDKLTAGKTIILPIPKDHLYQIKPKETLWRIAKRYGITLELLQELNGIKDPTKVSTGQTIILPCPASKIADNKF
jgi:general secretion pathway protein D